MGRPGERARERYPYGPRQAVQGDQDRTGEGLARERRAAPVAAGTIAPIGLGAALVALARNPREARRRPENTLTHSPNALPFLAKGPSDLPNQSHRTEHLSSEEPKAHQSH